MNFLLQANSFLHAGNVLYLIAYLVRDVLWLRVISVAGMLALLAFYWMQPTPMYMAIAWNSLFMAVNIVQISILILERRPVFLGEEELHLYRTLFRSLKPVEFKKLLSIADWKKAKAGEELIAQNKPVDSLVLISSGRGAVEMDDRHVAYVYSGQFVGEMGFLTEQDATARVVAVAPTDYLAWPTAKLRSLLAATPGLHVKFQGVLGRDVVGKLHHEAVSTAHPSRVATELREAGIE
jgi:hypothetical protein